MASLNKIILVGEISSEIEKKIATTGEDFISFKLLVHRPANPVGQILVDEFTVVVWGNTAERSQDFCHKNALVSVEGRISTRTYEDENNQRHWVTEIQAYRVRPINENLGSSSESNFGNSTASFQANAADIRVKNTPHSNFDFGTPMNTAALSEEVPF